MKLKIAFVMSLLALSTLAIAASQQEAEADDSNIEALVVKSVEDSVAKRLALLVEKHPQ